MTNNTKLLLGCGGTILIVAVAILCIAAFAAYKGYSLYADSDSGGRVFGATTDQEGCLKEGLRRGEYTTSDKLDQFTNGTFVQGCLEVSRPVENFCDGVPAVFDRDAQSKWAKGECQKAGQNDNTGCLQVYNEKHTFCGFPNPSRGEK